MRRIQGLMLVFLGLMAFVATAEAQEPPNGDPVQGARLYDAWYNEQDTLPPDGDHPLWRTQNANPRSGVTTWRCVTCHGWDYKGADGIYGPGSAEYSGFPGVIGVVGASEAEIRAWLDGTRNPDHNFVQFLPASATKSLIAFLRTRLVNSDLLIDPLTAQAFGAPGRGASLYALECLECHGEDGSSINFGSANNPIFLGDLAQYDPWRTLHKTRFGQPNSEMPAADRRGSSLQDLADLLAYAQTFPALNTASLTRQTSGELDYSQQGDTTSIVIGAIMVFAVVVGGVAWTAMSARGVSGE